MQILARFLAERLKRKEFFTDIVFIGHYIYPVTETGLCADKESLM